MYLSYLKIGATAYSKGGFLKISFYEDGGAVAIEIVEKDQAPPELRATVNFPDFELKPEYIVLKGWSENKGVPEAFQEAGLVEKTNQYIRTGHTSAEIFRMKPELLSEVEKARTIHASK